MSPINVPLLKEQLKRFWAVGAAIMLVYTLFGILPLYMASNENPLWVARIMVDMLAMGNPAPIIGLIAGPLFAVLTLYPYHFAGNATTAFYSFPVTKRQLFCTNIAAAMILIFVPLIIFCLILLVPVQYTGPSDLSWPSTINFPAAVFPNGVEVGHTINTLSVVAGFFLRMAVGSIFYFSLFMLAVSVSGHIAVAILLCGAFTLLPSALHFLIEMIASGHVFGYFGNNARLTSTLAFSNPVMWSHWINRQGIANVDAVDMPRLFPYHLFYIAASAVLTAIAYKCSLIRKLERTGDSVVFTAFNNVCVFLVATSGMVLMGGFLLGTTQSRVGLYLGFVIGFILAYIIAQMIAEKSFNIIGKFNQLIPYGGVMVALYLVMLLITNFGLSFYINRVPQVNEVLGVSLSHSFNWRPDQYTNDPESIANTIEIHHEILNNRRYLRSVFWRQMTGDWQNTMNIPISYKLADGSVIMRRYVVSIDFMESSSLGELINSPAIIMAEMDVLRQLHMVERIGISILHEERTNEPWGRESRSRGMTFASGQNEIASLIEAVLEDYIAIRQEDWRNRQLHSGFEDGRQSWTVYEFHIEIYREYWDDFRWWLWMPSLELERAPNVTAWLEERDKLGMEENNLIIIE